LSQKRLEGLKEAQSIRQLTLTEEQKAQEKSNLEAQKGTIEEQKRVISRERLIELGIKDGATQIEIAKSVRAEEVALSALKAKGFEAAQVAARLQLDFTQQQKTIELQILGIQAQKALIEAKASNNQEAIAGAQQFVKLVQTQTEKTTELFDVQKKTLKLQQDSQRAIENSSIAAEDYKSKIALTEAGAGKAADSFARVAISAKDTSSNLLSASDAANKLNEGVDKTTAGAKNLVSATEDVGKNIDIAAKNAQALTAELGKQNAALKAAINSGTKEDALKALAGDNPIEARASGGNVYRINEEGQESYTPKSDPTSLYLLGKKERVVSFAQDGYVHNASDTSSFLGGDIQARAGGGVVTTTPVTRTAGTNPTAPAPTQNRFPSTQEAPANPNSQQLGGFFDRLSQSLNPSKPITLGLVDPNAFNYVDQADADRKKQTNLDFKVDGKTKFGYDASGSLKLVTDQIDAALLKAQGIIVQLPQRISNFKDVTKEGSIGDSSGAKIKVKQMQGAFEASIGLLPSLLKGAGGFLPGFDISGAGASEGQFASYETQILSRIEKLKTEFETIKVPGLASGGFTGQRFNLPSGRSNVRDFGSNSSPNITSVNRSINSISSTTVSSSSNKDLISEIRSLSNVVKIGNDKVVDINKNANRGNTSITIQRGENESTMTAASGALQAMAAANLASAGIGSGRG